MSKEPTANQPEVLAKKAKSRLRLGGTPQSPELGVRFEDENEASQKFDELRTQLPDLVIRREGAIVYVESSKVKTPAVDATPATYTSGAYFGRNDGSGFKKMGVSFSSEEERKKFAKITELDYIQKTVQTFDGKSDIGFYANQSRAIYFREDFLIRNDVSEKIENFAKVLNEMIKPKTLEQAKELVSSAYSALTDYTNAAKLAAQDPEVFGKIGDPNSPVEKMIQVAVKINLLGVTNTDLINNTILDSQRDRFLSHSYDTLIQGLPLAAQEEVKKRVLLLQNIEIITSIVNERIKGNLSSFTDRDGDLVTTIHELTKNNPGILGKIGDDDSPMEKLIQLAVQIQLTNPDRFKDGSLFWVYSLLVDNILPANARAEVNKRVAAATPKNDSEKQLLKEIEVLDKAVSDFIKEVKSLDSSDNLAFQSMGKQVQKIADMCKDNELLGELNNPDSPAAKMTKIIHDIYFSQTMERGHKTTQLGQWVANGLLDVFPEGEARNKVENTARELTPKEQVAVKQKFEPYESTQPKNFQEKRPEPVKPVKKASFNLFSAIKNLFSGKSKPKAEDNVFEMTAKKRGLDGPSDGVKRLDAKFNEITNLGYKEKLAQFGPLLDDVKRTRKGKNLNKEDKKILNKLNRQLPDEIGKARTEAKKAREAEKELAKTESLGSIASSKKNKVESQPSSTPKPNL